MDTKRILYVSQEIHPYLPENEISKLSLELPKKMNKIGHEVRVFMPRYGLINERRHQLHEVIRLSGINIVINDIDQPLIIKVASLPTVRVQVYFIDNEEFFKRKATFYDKEGKFFNDNDERAIFFCKGVIEAVKKFGWAPDIIHCHGWMTSFIPLYLKKFHDDDPLFADSKRVFSVYESKSDKMPDTLINNLRFDDIDERNIKKFEDATIDGLYKAAATYCDGVVISSKKSSAQVKKFITGNVPNYIDISRVEDHTEKINDLYKQVFMEESIA